jgi:hypothetical protein
MNVILTTPDDVDDNKRDISLVYDNKRDIFISTLNVATCFENISQQITLIHDNLKFLAQFL